MAGFLAISLSLLFSTLISSAWADKEFKWAFRDSKFESSLPTCQRQAITISPFDTVTNASMGKPPYYMLAFPNGGTPTTTLIGNDFIDVSFMHLYPVGTQLLLSVVDSTGSSGGTHSPEMVVNGPATDCLPKATTSTFTMKTNVTKELTTCEPLGISISGGTGPYTVSLLAADAPSVTTATLKGDDNIYTYINRASPGGQIVAAVADSKGQWASGSILLTTKGSANVDCPGLISSSSKGDLKDPPPSINTTTVSTTTTTATNSTTTSKTSTTTSLNSTSTTTGTSKTTTFTDSTTTASDTDLPNATDTPTSSARVNQVGIAGLVVAVGAVMLSF